MVSMAEALSAAADALGLAKEIASPVKPLDKAALNRKGTELTNAIQTTTSGLVVAQKTLKDKEDELTRIKATVTKLPHTVLSEGFIYDKVNGKPTGLAYCPDCLTKDHHLERLTLSKPHPRCPRCANVHAGARDFGPPKSAIEQAYLPRPRRL